MTAVVDKKKEYELKRKGLLYDIVKHRTILLMLLPTLLYFLIFRYGPILGLIIAFQDFTPQAGRGFYESILASPWVGFKYFEEFFTSMNGLIILRNTILISFYKIVFGFPAPIILALMLNEVRNMRYKKVLQTVTYLPHFISWVILAGIIRILFSPDYGLIVPIFEKLNIETINFLGDARYFRGLLVFSDIWQSMGWGTVVYLATLSGLDLQLYEAARIDGANRFKQLIHITIPGMAPTITIMLIMRTGTILNAGFDQVFNLYNPAVYSVADIIDTHIYYAGLTQMRFSYTTAVGFFQSLVGVMMVLGTNFFAKRLGQEGIV